MIIWSGFGILVAILGFGSLVATEAITRAAFDEKYYQAHGWPKLAAFWLAAGLVYVLGLWLDRRPGRAVIDKTTGQEIILKKANSLFFIPVRYWTYVFLVLGIIFLFVRK